MVKNASKTGNYTDPKTGKVVSSGQYIPDDNPDLIKKQKRREKTKEISKKVTNFISPILTKKFKKRLKEEEVSEKPKLATTKYNMENRMNRKANKMTALEGSFAKGGRAGYKGGGMSTRGLGRAFMKGGKV